MNISANKILVLSPHTDDGEFGAGASISRFIKEGKEVRYVAFSIAQDSVPEPYPKESLALEVQHATAVLKLKDPIVMAYPVRKLAEHRQEILEVMVSMNKEFEPDLVLMPSLNDMHQDHSVVAQEGLRAFKRSSILCYELPWNNLQFSNTCFVTFTEDEVIEKVTAISNYKSQRGKQYSHPDFLRSLAVTRGTQIGAEYAEVFEVLRLVI